MRLKLLHRFRLMSLILLADENVDASIVAVLRAAGHRVDYVRELDPGIVLD
jgi:hypothetical protein